MIARIGRQMRPTAIHRMICCMILLAAGFSTGPAASPAQAANCPSSSGVTVIVDLTAFGLGVKRGCASGDPATGLAALTGAGFSFTFVPGQPGFICQIKAKPNPCNGAPATAYWSYWHAPRGGSWTYSALGASSYNPAPRSVEGWAFGAGSAPSVNPPS